MVARTSGGEDAQGEAGPGFWKVDLGAGVRAGFTTRRGGCSGRPWDSFNLGAAVGDDLRHVRANRAVAAGLMGAPIAFSTQVHGTRTKIVESPGWSSEVEPPLAVGTADALVTTATDVALGVLVADCVPVLIADPVARVVASAHAGRRGLAEGVLASVFGTLVELGARPSRMQAAVGPSICGECYEVPAELRDEVAALIPETRSVTEWETPALDLAAGVIAQLTAFGASVTRIEACTRTDGRFFSYRGSPGGRTGRFAGIIRLEPIRQ